MKLPRLLLLTDGAQAAAAGHDLVDLIARAVEAGARAVLLRERHLPAGERRDLAAHLADLLHAAGGWLLVASPPLAPGDGVHLRAGEAVPDPRPELVGRSCHDHAELRAAAADGCDYATLSPIFLTASKPGYGPALGPEALAGAPLPVFALGGITSANAGACVAAGAAGVAVMGAVMAAPDPARVVTDLLTALENAP